MSKNKNLKGGAPVQRIKHGRIRQSAPNRSTVSSSPITQTINQQHTTNVQQQDISDTSGDNVLQGGALAQRVGHGRARPPGIDTYKKNIAEAEYKIKEAQKNGKTGEVTKLLEDIKRYNATIKKLEEEYNKAVARREAEYRRKEEGEIRPAEIPLRASTLNRKKTSFCSVL